MNGTVAINTLSLDPDAGLVELPDGLADASNQIRQTCDASEGNSFIATGRGGVPPSPLQSVDSHRTWTDTRNLSAFLSGPVVSPGPAVGPFVETNTWHVNAMGQVELLAVSPNGLENDSYETCGRSLGGSRSN